MRLSLLASLAVAAVIFPAVASASEPAAANAQPVRVSTGVTAPALITPIKLDIPGTTLKPISGQVELSLLVDEKGIARDVKVTRSLSPFWDARVITAVTNGHFAPAKLDNQSIPMSLDLTINVQ